MRIAAVANAGARRSVRTAYRRSRQASSIHVAMTASCARSRYTSGLPSLDRARWRACSGSVPRASSSSSRSARWVSRSSRSSSSIRARRKTFQARRRSDVPMSTMASSGESQRFPDGDRQELPPPLFVFELPAAGGRNRVEAGFPAGLGGPRLRLQPFLVGHPLKCWLERPFFDSKVLAGGLMDPPRDGVAVQRSRTRQRLEDEKVQRALQAVVGMFGHI